MSRITAPAAKLSRTLLESQRSAGAVLMPKYDELLRTRRAARSPEQSTESSRHLTTKHRPTPQPSIVGRPKPLMQTFHHSASSTAPAHLDATVLPGLHATSIASEPMPRMPLLPDNYTGSYASSTDLASADAATAFSGPHTSTIVAANPDAVVAGAPLTAIEGVTIDGVELKFGHEQASPVDESSFWKDILRGMADDLLAQPPKPAVN